MAVTERQYKTGCGVVQVKRLLTKQSNDNDPNRTQTSKQTLHSKEDICIGIIGDYFFGCTYTSVRDSKLSLKVAVIDGVRFIC
jgi:hypothetical protein